MGEGQAGFQVVKTCPEREEKRRRLGSALRLRCRTGFNRTDEGEEQHTR
jgi:hypothetical protein